jgi:hypothetical protein
MFNDPDGNRFALEQIEAFERPAVIDTEASRCERLEVGTVDRRWW